MKCTKLELPSMNRNTYFTRFFQILAKYMNLQRFVQKNSFLARFLQTMSILQESCRKRNSCKKRPVCHNLPRLVIFCKILQDSVRLMHYLPRSCKNPERNAFRLKQGLPPTINLSGDIMKIPKANLP